MPEDFLNQPPPKAGARIAYGEDPNQFFDLRLPKSAAANFPLVINIHGGFWRAKYGLEHAGHFCAAITAQGLATANLEYRRVGNVGGGWPGTLDDIRAAYKDLRENASAHNIDPQKIVITGHSAGGHLALCLAAYEPTVTHVVALAAITELHRACELHLSNDAAVEFLGGAPEQVAQLYREADPMQLSIARAEQWIVHGLTDDVVPPTFSSDYVSLKQNRPSQQKEPVHLLEIAGADHYDLIDPHSAAWKEIQPLILRLAHRSRL